MSLLQSLHNILPMSVASLSFVYLYLPLSLLIYYVLHRAARALFLLVCSLGFLILAQPKYFLFTVIAVLLDYAFVQAIVILRRPLLRRGLFWLCAAMNTAFILYFYCFAHRAYAAMPLGLFVVCLSAIDLAHTVYRAPEPQPQSLVFVMLYLCFFPRIYAGPLLSPKDFLKQLSRIDFDVATVSNGFRLFAAGLFKYAVFGRGLFLFYNSIHQSAYADLSVLSAWCLAFSFALSLYFTLSGFSDIARGVAALFGLRLPQNFYYPYQSRSISDFFERFNITVGGFYKRVFLDEINTAFPGAFADICALLVTGALWGCWFGMRVNYIAWGVLIAIFLILEKYCYPRAFTRLPVFFCRIYAIIITLSCIVIPASDSLLQSGEYFRHMFGFFSGVPLVLKGDPILYQLSSNWLLLALSCLFATSLFSLGADAIRKAFPRAGAVMSNLVSTGVLLLFTAFSFGGGLL